MDCNNRSYIYKSIKKNGEYLWYKIEEWQEEYVKYKKGKNTNPYHDPDAVRDNCVDNQPYYNLLTDFLNAKGRDKGMFFSPPNIKMKKPYDRTILMTNADNENLFLCSDQFGFSETGDNLWNPYYSIISKFKNENEAFNFVAQCLFKTREIGGSFIWPKQQYRRNLSCHYNNQRGKEPIRDRVDLTLMEIKNYLDCGKPKDRYDVYKANYRDSKSLDDNKIHQLLFCEITNETTGMKKWLDHFESFTEYVDFFAFDDFCVKLKDETGNIKYYPKDITVKEYPKDITEKEYIEFQREKTKKIEDMEADELKAMLEKLCDLVKNRSVKMIDSLRKTRERI